MYNDILKIGGITIHGYGLAIGVGVLCAVFLAEYRGKKGASAQTGCFPSSCSS